jgi:hypothetical protein
MKLLVAKAQFDRSILALHINTVLRYGSQARQAVRLACGLLGTSMNKVTSSPKRARTAPKLTSVGGKAIFHS